MAGQFKATEAMSAVNAVNGVSTEKQLAPATSKQQAITQKVQNDAGNLATEEHVKQEQEKNGLQLGEWKADKDNPGTLTRQLVNRNLTGKREDSSGTGSPAVSDYLENQRQLSTERTESPTFGNVYSSTDARESSLYGSKYADILSKSDYAEKSAPTGSKIKLIGTDQRYDYINDINGFRETADMNAVSGTGDTTLQKWALLTKDEVGVYNYLYNTKGKKEANNFLTELEPEINAQWASGINKTMEEAANRNAGTKALMTAATIAGAPVRGMAGAGALVEDAIRTASGRGIDPNSRLRQPTMVTQNIRESIAEPMGGVGQFLYNAGTAAGDSAMNMLVARGLGAMGGLTGTALMKMTNLITSTIMSSEVAAASVAESKNKGYSDLGAMSLGLTRGGIEWASEKVGGDWIIKNVKSNPLNLLKTVVLGMIPEGVEENMSDVGNEGVNLLVDLVCGTDESFIRRTFNYYKDAGAEHPVLETMKAVVQQELLSFAGGALATVGSSTVQSYNMRSAINESAQIMDATPLDVVNQMTELGTDNPYYAAFMNESAKKLNSTTEEVRQLMQDLDEDNPQVVSMLADLHEAKSMDELRQKVGQVQEESRAVDAIMAGAEQLKKTEQTAAVESKVNEAVNNMVTGAPAEPVTPAATTPTETGLQLQQEGEINEAIQQSTAPEEQGLSGPEPIRAGEGEPAGRGAEADIIRGGTKAGAAAAVSTGGPAVSGGSTGWDLGGRTGGQTGRVEQTTGTGSRVTADGERRRTVGENVRIALRERGLEAESTNSLGFARGTDNGTFYTVPEDLQEQEWKDLGYGIRMNTGYNVQFIVGQMEVMGNDGKVYHVNGCCDHDNHRIIIRVDSEKYSARQLGKHEEFHALAQRDQGLVRAVRDQLADQYGREQMASIVKGYILKRRGINDIENGGQDAFTQEFDELWEELFADAYGGMNAFEMGANRYMAPVAGVVGDRRSWDRSRTPRGPPGLWRVKILEKERQDLMNRLSGLRREGDGYVDAKGKFYTEQQADKLASQIADRDEEIERLQQAARPGQTFSDAAEYDMYDGGTQYSLSEDEEWPEGTLVNRRAIVSEETLDQWLKDYAASNPEYAQAYIAYISPEKFLNLTTSGAGSRYAIRQQAEGLTLPSVMDYSREQPIQLRINTETGKVEGHEGRHRMVALNRAGVEKVPVLLFDSSNKYGKQPMESIRLIQQDFNGKENTDTETVRDLEPLSTGNRETVLEKFSKKDTLERMNEKYSGKKTVQFSVSEEEEETRRDEETVDAGNTALEVNKKAGTVEPKFSLDTWEESDYVTDRDNAAKDLAKAIGVTQKKARSYIDDINSVARMIGDERARLDYEDTGLSPFVSNIEYGGSFDFTTLCKKRRLLTGTFSAIQRALPNTALTANEILQIRKMMDDAGLEVSCGKCYVEGSRANMGQFTQEFINLYKKYYPGQWTPNMAEMNTPDGIEWVRNNHPEVYEQYEYFWNHYGTLRPGDPNLFASQQKPKLYQMRSAYKGEILEHFQNEDSIDEKNENGGVRMQSFSDFEIVHLIDAMQVITDMARVGLNGQAYTKVPDFAWALGKTGLKINLSIDAWSVDENGKLVFNNKEGMNFEEAMRIRRANSENVGTICCVYDDAQLLAAMADDRIDFIIPFHRSQWKKSQYKGMGLPATTKDYTYQQNEKWIDPALHTHEYRGREVPTKCENYMPNTYWDFRKSGKQNAEKYLRMCAEDGKRPKFYKLLTNNGDGSYSLKKDGSTDGYWKLLIDFKMYDNNGRGAPQRPVRPEFNMEEVNRMLKSYEGGHSQFPVAQGVVDEFVEQYKESHPGKTMFSVDEDDQYDFDDLTGGEYSLSGTEGPNHEWELAKVLTSRTKDLLTGYEPEGWDGPITEENIDEWMEPDAYHDRMANLFSDPDQVLDLLYEMSQDDPKRKEEIFQLMDRIVRTMGPDRAQRYTLERDREGGLSLGGGNDYAEFKRWFNERNPSLYFPGYVPGELFDSGNADFWSAQEAQEAEAEYLRSLIDDPNVSEETRKDAEEFLQKLENPENWETDWYDPNTGRMSKRRYREIFYSTDEDERRESTGEEELGEARLTDEEKTIEELRKDNDQLREYAEYWKKQGRITGKGENRAKRSDVQKLAKDLATHADYQGDKAELQQKLQDLANMIVSDDKGAGLSWTNVHEAASEIAELLVDNSYQMLDPEKDTREQLAARAKELKIRPDDMWTKDFGDWKEYRQKQFNKLVFNREGQDIDTVYQTLRSEFGDGMFPEDVTAGSDQVRRIVQVLDQLQPERAYSFASDEEAEMATAFYTNIIEDELLFGNIGEELTRADKNYQRVKERMAKAEEKVKKVREEKKDLQKMQRLEMRAALDEQRRNLNRREETQKVRKRIDKTAKRLLKWLDENAGKNPIPEPMKGPVGELLLSLDISGGMEKHQKERYLESMENVAKIVTRQFDYMSGQDDAWDGMYLDLPPDIRKTLDDHLESIRKAMRGEEKRGRVWNPNMMNLEELNQLDEILTTVSSAITSANEILSDERGKHISEMAAPTIQHLNELGSDKTRSSWRDKINNFMRFNNLTPYYFFKKLGPAGTEMFEKIQDGWDKFAFNARQIINFANETYTAKEAKEIQQKTETFQLRRKGDMSEGFDKPEKVTMTHAQIMSLYCLWKREQARGHIAGAGIRISDFKNEKGKEVKQAENYLIDLDDIAKITGTLSKREKEIADKLQKYMNTVGSDWGNEVSLRRFGIRSFTEDNYFPIETDDRTRPVRSPERDSTDLYRLLNMGFTKATVRNANNALVVNNIFDVFANHMADMAKYNGLGLPMLDTLKWFSYNQMGAADENGQYGYESIQKSLERAYGRHARNYFTSFIKDLNGVREGGHGLDLLSRAISNYKVAAVGANLRVAVLQPTSYARALAVLDKKYLAKGMKMDNKQGREEALKYSGTAVWKDLGFYDTNINAGLREMIKHDDGWKEKAQDIAMKPAEMGDKVTWGALWNACKAEQEDKGLKGEKLIEATAKRFREVVYRTQVMDSTMTRSHIMRQKDGLMTFYTAFMSEPTLSYNMMLDAYGEYEADRRKGMSKKDALKKNGKTMKMAGAAYLTTATLSAIVESLIDAARDDDEYASFLERLVEKLLGFNPKDPDETVWEKFKASLNGNLLDDLLLHNKLPLVKDLAGMLNGDNPGRMDTEWFGNIVKALNIWKETLGLQLGWQDEPTDATYNGNMTTWGKIYNTLRAASQITGLPLGNGIRDLVALWNTTVGEASKDMKIQTYDPGEEKKIKYAVKDGYLTEDEAVDWLMKYEVAEDEDEARQMVYVWAHPEKYERLLDAMNAGDMDEFNAAKEELRDLHFKPSSIEAAVKNEVHELYVGRDGEEPIDRETAVQMLVDYGGMIQRKADEQVQKWTSEIETGVGFDAIGDAYVAGDINREQAVQMLMLYGGYAQEKAEAKVQQWTSEIETGIGYNEIGDRFFYDEITKDEAIDMYMKYGGKSEEDALDAVNKVDFKKLTGHERERIELETMYMEGRYSRDEMKKIMVDYGYSKTEESAENSLIRWDFIGDNVEELDAVTPWQAKRYFEMVDDAEIDKKTYLQFAEQAEQLKADYDENGKAIAYSKMNKVFALIDSLDLTPEQKTALAEAGWDSNNDGYSEKNIEKYAPWEGGTAKKTTKKKSGGGRRGGGGGRRGGSSTPQLGNLELGSIADTGHRGIFNQILAGWKRKKYSRAQILALVRTGKLTQEEADEILATKQEVEEPEIDGSLALAE